MKHTLKTLFNQRSSLRTLAFSLLLIAATPSAMAVQLSDQGQALIFPYIGVKNDNNMLVTISSYRGESKALKVHLRDKSGDSVASFNIYLKGRGTWAAAFSRSDGETRLTVNADHCTVPELSELSSQLSDFESGYMEVIEMGQLDPRRDPFDFVQDSDCAALSNLWSGGTWSSNPEADLFPPVGNLQGTSSIINVTKGTQYSIEVVALAAFSSIIQHTPADSVTPNLGSAHDDGTDSGTTSSEVCGDNGCMSYQWASPLDAVASVLMAYSVNGEFSAQQSISAQSEIVATFPLRHLYEQAGNQDFARNRVGFEILSRTGEGDIIFAPCTPLIQIDPCTTPYNASYSDSVEVIPFGRDVAEAGSVVTSFILGEPGQVEFPTSQYPNLPSSGTFSMYLGREVFDSINTVNDERIFGKPVIASVLLEAANGQLTDPETNQLVRANYGTSTTLRKGESRR